MTPDVREQTVPVHHAHGQPPWGAAPRPEDALAAIHRAMDAIWAELDTDPAKTAIEAVE